MVDSQCALPETSDRSALLILPAMLVRRGKYSVADPLFVEERRPVLVARKLRRGAEAGDIVLVNAREKNRSLRGEVTRVIGSSEDPRNVYEALFAPSEHPANSRERSMRRPRPSHTGRWGSVGTCVTSPR
jgi:hypothetical protein